MDNIIYTDWWQAIGLCIILGLMGICIYNLWDLKREEASNKAALQITSEHTWKAENSIQLKEPAYIYPKNEVDNDEVCIPKKSILKGGYSHANEHPLSEL
ncbi:hypothetical protein ASD24_29715 [Paenibacillus sp. Root52]|uniref:hypothetical protein n=1 Tax=Paenibacillus sp. Root52 TaxID=1736552 RepID=UPI0006F90413|nr:hypothetical protein [Paenibacillus sp. Root52]KQY83551.1 hypothetical protein ASD24_29715 [Paenibacillus sp. Root52]